MKNKFHRKTNPLKKLFRYQAIGLLLIILGSTLLMSQTQVNNYVEVKTYGKTKDINSLSEKIIKLEAVKNYDNLLKKMNLLLCNNSTPVLQIQVNKHLIKKIYPVNICPYANTCYLFRRYNIIEITNRRIIKGGDTYPIDSLYYIMQKDYTNGKNPKYCRNTNRLTFFINYKNKSISKLITDLNKLTDYHDSLQKGNILKLHFSLTQQIIPVPIKVCHLYL